MGIKEIFDFFWKKQKSKFKSIYLIVNPKAGRHKISRFIKAIQNILDQQGIKYDFSITDSPGAATEIAKKAVHEKYELIFAAGGDGTINEVINGIVGSKAVLGIIPLGTINILALALNLPLNPIKALQLFIKGKIKKIDLGKANNRYFVIMAGVGFDSYAIYRVNLKWKKFLGALAYVIAAIYSVFKYKPKKIIIDIDNHRIDELGYFVVVENISAYGGRFRINPNAKYDDGLLDVCVFKNHGALNAFRYFAGITFQRHIDYPDVRYYQCKKITLHSKENVLLHTDGDLVGSLPVEITAHKSELKVLCQ